MTDGFAASTSTARPRIFWGWWVFAAAIVGQFVTIGFSSQATGVFLKPMTEEFGAYYSLAAVIAAGATLIVASRRPSAGEHVAPPTIAGGA